MGNSNLCPRYSQPKRSQEAHVCVNLEQLDNSSVVSVTLPSICDESSVDQLNKKLSKKASDASFKFHETELMFFNYKKMIGSYKLTPKILDSVSHLVRIMRSYTHEICLDLYKGEMEPTFFEKFEEIRNIRQRKTGISSKEGTIIHYFQILEIHTIILDHFITNNPDKVRTLLQQIAISHALMGINREYFITMNVNLARYWINKKLLGDELLKDVVIYLNTITNYIIGVYEYQDGRNSIIRTLLTETESNDRENKARNNYRLMKKWNKFVQYLQKYNSEIKDILLSVSYTSNRNMSNRNKVSSSYFQWKHHSNI